MNNREIFETVVKKAAKQGFQKSVSGGKCAYRGVNNRSCNVGHLLTDRQAAAGDNMSDSTLDSLIKHKILPDRFVPHKQFLKELQQAHDDASGPISHAKKLKSIARSNHWKVPEAITKFLSTKEI